MAYEEFLYYLFICFLLSFLIGVERQYRKRIIGLRTTILVSIGAFLFVSFSFTIGATDISRIASQVVAGIGFLGAGVILKDGKKIRGLTTAATLWCNAAIGVLCAGGAIKEAIVGTFVILFSNIVLRYVNRLINEISSNKHTRYHYQLLLTSNNTNIKKIKKDIVQFIENNKIETISTTMRKKNKEITINYDIEITKEEVLKLEKVIDELNDDDLLISFELKKISEIKLDETDEDL